MNEPDYKSLQDRVSNNVLRRNSRIPTATKTNYSRADNVANYHNNRSTSKIPQPNRRTSVTPTQNLYHELPKLKQNVTLPVIKTSRNQNHGGDNNNNNFQKPPPTSVSLNSINSERMNQLEPRLRSEQSFVRNWPDKMKSVREKAKQRAIAVQELKDQKSYLFEQLQRKQTELNFIQHEQQQEKVNELSRSESSMSNKNYDKRSEVFSPDNLSLASEKLAHIPHSTVQSVTPRHIPKQVPKQVPKAVVPKAVVPTHILPKRVLPKPVAQKRVPPKQAAPKPVTPPPVVTKPRAKTAKRRKPKTTFLTHDPMVFDTEEEPENQVIVPVTPLRPARETTRVEIDQKTPTKSQVSKIPRKSPQKSPQKPPQQQPPPQKPLQNSIELAKTNRSRKNSQAASNRDSKNSNHADLPQNGTELVTSTHSFDNHKANDVPAASIYDNCNDPDAGKKIETFPCTVCGREFAKARLAKHRRACKKITKPRKKFDTTNQRIVDGAKQYSREIKQMEKEGYTKKETTWREKSNSLREAMKASRQYTREKAAETDDYKPRQKLHQRTNQAQKSHTNTWKK